MDRKSSKRPPAQDPNFLQVPSRAPPGALRRSHAGTRRRSASPVPIEPTRMRTESPVPIQPNPDPPQPIAAIPQPPPVKMAYDEAAEYLEANIGERIVNPAAMEDTPTGVVLYEPRGTALIAGKGPQLSNNASICFLISWLQVFTDNFIARNHPGYSLVVRCVEFQVFDGEVYSRLPNLEGGLSYVKTGTMVSARVTWPSDGTLMEKYWELLRTQLRIGSDGMMKCPIIKIRTVKFYTDDYDGIPVAKTLGSGHLFLVNGQSLDIFHYFQLKGERVPRSITNLDDELTRAARQDVQQLAAEKKAKDEAALNEILHRRTVWDAARNRRDALADPQQVQDANATTHSHPSAAEASTGSAPGLTPTNLNNVCDTGEKKPAQLQPTTRDQPLSMVSIPMGNSTADVVLPFRPPIHPDPARNWRQYQRAGGNPLMHDAFPLDHMPFDLKDMPKPKPLPPMMPDVVFKEGQYYMQSTISNETATSHSRDASEAQQSQTAQDANVEDGTGKADVPKSTPQQIEEYWRSHEAAIGFDEEDDEKFFPSSCMNKSEAPMSVGNNNLTVPIHRHGYRPSQNEDAARGTQMHEYAGMPAPTHNGGVAFASRAPSRAESSEKKFTSTMNVNAPEFIKRPASMNQDADYEHKPALATGYSDYPLSKVGFSSTTPFDPQPFPMLNPELFEADNTSQAYGGGKSQPFGADNSQVYGGGNSEPFGADNSQPFGAGNSQPYRGGNSQPFGAGNSQLYGGGNSKPFGGDNSQTFGANNSRSFGAGNSQPYGADSSHIRSYPYGANNPQSFGVGNSQEYGADSSQMGSYPYGASNSQSFGVGNSQEYGPDSSQIRSYPYGANKPQSLGVGNSQEYGADSSQMGSYPYGASKSQSFGVGNAQPSGGGNSQPFGADSSQIHSYPYGMGNSQSHGAANSQQQGGAVSQQYGAGNSEQHGPSSSHPYGGGPSQQYGGAISRQYGAGNSHPFSSAPGQAYLAYASSGRYNGASDPYQPSISKDSSFSGNSTYKPIPIGPQRPPMGPSKLISTNAANRNFYGYNRGKNGGGGAPPTSVEEFGRRVARHGDPSQYEVKRESQINDSVNRATSNRGPNNAYGSKKSWRPSHSRGL